MIRECFPVRGKLKIIPGSGKGLHRPGNMRKRAPRLGKREGTHNSHSEGRVAGEGCCARFGESSERPGTYSEASVFVLRTTGMWIQRSTGRISIS